MLRKRKSSRKPKLGLSMRGGGTRCFSYIGVIKYLEEKDQKIGHVIGSSGGALIAAMYAFGYSIEELSKLASELKIREFVGFKSITTRTLLSEVKVRERLEKLFGNQKIENALTPLTIQATDNETGENVLLTQGNVVSAVMASMANSIILPPIEFGGQKLVDGDYSSTYATSYLKENGCDTVIGMYPGPYLPENPQDSEKNPVARSFRSISISLYNLVKFAEKLDPPDYVIENMAGDLYFLDTSKTGELVQTGYEKAREVLQF